MDIKKICANQLTAAMLTKKFSDTLGSFLSKDDAYQLMGNIKGAPPC